MKAIAAFIAFVIVVWIASKKLYREGMSEQHDLAKLLESSGWLSIDNQTLGVQPFYPTVLGEGHRGSDLCPLLVSEQGEAKRWLFMYDPNSVTLSRRYEGAVTYVAKSDRFPEVAIQLRRAVFPFEHKRWGSEITPLEDVVNVELSGGWYVLEHHDSAQLPSVRTSLFALNNSKDLVECIIRSKYLVCMGRPKRHAKSDYTRIMNEAMAIERCLLG